MLFNQNINTSRKLLSLGYRTDYDHHIHTKYSDGAFTLGQIIEMAKQSRLKRIVITDHNKILDCSNELKTISKEYLGTLKVFVGSEIACKILDPITGVYIPIELLYYGPNPKNVQAFIDQYHYGMVPQEEQLQFLIKQCNKHNLKHSENLQVPKGMFATEYLCKDLLKYPENKTFFDSTHPIVYDAPKLFFKKFCIHPSSDFYIDTTKNLPMASEVANMAIENGGVSIVAHPCLYIYEKQDEVILFLNYILQTTKVFGIEVFHASHTFEQRDYLYKFAKQHNLLIGGGSDFHSGPKTVVGFGEIDQVLSLSGRDFDWIENIF
ncbi:MAG: PHP domain-containing protein [Bacilli bacterium]|nr:PHP domain-containing protein [Bacilli bacterium]